MSEGIELGSMSGFGEKMAVLDERPPVRELQTPFLGEFVDDTA